MSSPDQPQAAQPQTSAGNTPEAVTTPEAATQEAAPTSTASTPEEQGNQKSSENNTKKPKLTKEQKLVRRDLGMATFILRLWVATFCFTAGITKFQTSNPAGSEQDIFSTQAWSGGTVEAQYAKEDTIPEGDLPTVEMLWRSTNIQEAGEGKSTAKGFYLAKGMKDNGGPLLNHPLISSTEIDQETGLPIGFDLVTLFTMALPWAFLATGAMVLLGITRRFSAASAAMICLSLAFGLWSMYQGSGSAEAVTPLMQGFVPAIALIALARYNPLCLLPRL